GCPRPRTRLEDLADRQQAAGAERVDVLGRAREDGGAAARLLRQVDLRAPAAPLRRLVERGLESRAADVVRKGKERCDLPEEPDERSLRRDVECALWNAREHDCVPGTPPPRNALHVRHEPDAPDD